MGNSQKKAKIKKALGFSFLFIFFSLAGAWDVQNTETRLLAKWGEKVPKQQRTFLYIGCNIRWGWKFPVQQFPSGRQSGNVSTLVNVPLVDFFVRETHLLSADCVCTLFRNKWYSCWRLCFHAFTSSSYLLKDLAEARLLRPVGNPWIKTRETELTWE